MNASTLAQIFELLAQALRLIPDSSSLDSVVSSLAKSTDIEAQKVPAPAPAAKVEKQEVVPKERTLNQWLDVFETITAERGYKPQTLKNRGACVDHIRRLWGNLAITALKPHLITSGLKEFLPENSSTAQRILSELRDAYQEAVANDWIDKNPANHVKMPTNKVKRARLPFDTWLKMREHSKNSNQKWVESLLLLALITGQRRADLAKMKFSDIVQDERGNMVLRVEQQKHAGKGYGARVSIPLNLRLHAIDMTLEDVIKHCTSSACNGDTLIRKLGGGSIEESSLSSRFHECIKKVVEIDAYKKYQWPSLHECRSLADRLYNEQGTDVQTLLGHKHAEMTALYTDDRGLSSEEWKYVEVVPGSLQNPIPISVHEINQLPC